MTAPKVIRGAAKPDPTLVPPCAIIYESLAMSDGAVKYGPFSWRKEGCQVSMRERLGAALRHIMCVLDREDISQDALVDHLGHARADLGIVLDAREVGHLLDDRAPKGTAGDLLERFTKTAPAPDGQTGYEIKIDLKSKEEAAKTLLRQSELKANEALRSAGVEPAPVAPDGYNVGDRVAVVGSSSGVTRFGAITQLHDGKPFRFRTDAGQEFCAELGCCASSIKRLPTEAP